VNGAPGRPAGQGWGVRQGGRPTAAARDIEPMACPLGKLKLVSGAGEGQRVGRSRPKSCLVARFSTQVPSIERAKKLNLATSPRRRSQRASSTEKGTRPYQVPMREAQIITWSAAGEERSWIQVSTATSQGSDFWCTTSPAGTAERPRGAKSPSNRAEN